MKKQDKQIHDESIIHDILTSNTICRMALSDNGMPYIVPMNYGYQDNAVYLHTALEGKKIDIINRNSNVCFEITDSIDLVFGERGCDCTTKFRSVIGYGTISPVLHKDEKVNALRAIMKQHTGKSHWEFDNSIVQKTMVLKISIESLTGKLEKHLPSQ